MGTALDMSKSAQRQALGARLALGLLRPFSGLSPAVRAGEIARFFLSHWGVRDLPQKLVGPINYLTIAGRSHWLLLRESLLSVYNSWQVLPQITVVSDGTWTASEFGPVFAWWPGGISVKAPAEICEQAEAAGETDLRQYAEASAYGLKLAAIAMLARERPVLFADSDILWFRDPAKLLGPPKTWGKVRGVRESNCLQHRQIALQYCPEALNPPYVNSGMLTVKGDLLPSDLLKPLVREALADLPTHFIEQTIIATAVHKGGGLLPPKLCLVEFDDADKYRYRDMLKEGYFSRHYVNWMRHLLYRDALKLRLQRRSSSAGRGVLDNSGVRENSVRQDAALK
jgi:hypothetical protein